MISLPPVIFFTSSVAAVKINELIMSVTMELILISVWLQETGKDVGR